MVLVQIFASELDFSYFLLHQLLKIIVPTHFSVNNSFLARRDSMVSACFVQIRNTVIRGVRNPMKMSDISFLKTEPNRPQNSKTAKTRFPRFGFQKNDFGSLRTVFHVVSFTVHLLT